MHRIFTMTDEAREAGMDWDVAIYEGLLVTVEEFDSYEAAVAAFDDGGYDADLYGVE